MSFSHEIGTSLNCIISMTESLVNDYEVYSKINKKIDPILKSAQLLNCVILNIKDFNKILANDFSI